MDGAGESSCTLLGGMFAISVQVGLVIASIATLVYKRHTERPKRTWLVWSFDASKQAFAGGLQHLVNILFGLIFAVDGGASQCAWYFVNFFITVICGIFLLWLAVRGMNYVVETFHLTMLRTGEYGSPPNWRPWLLQLVVWGFLASGEKFVTAIFVIYPLRAPLNHVAQWLERPLLPYPNLELVLVMVFTPILLNILFFWVVDNLIKRSHRVSPSSSHPHGDDKQPLLEKECGCCLSAWRSTSSGVVHHNSSHHMTA